VLTGWEAQNAEEHGRAQVRRQRGPPVSTLTDHSRPRRTVDDARRRVARGQRERWAEVALHTAPPQSSWSATNGSSQIVLVGALAATIARSPD
jgi:hypothetical protein